MSRKFLLDALERVAATFVEVFAGALIVAPKIDWSALEAATFAGLVACLTVVKTVAASFLGDQESAAIGR